MPIAIGDEVLGVLDVQQNSVDGLGQQDVDLLESIAGQVAIALQNARSYQQERRTRPTGKHASMKSTGRSKAQRMLKRPCRLLFGNWAAF